MPANPHLDDADFAVLVALLKQTIAADRYPLSPRMKRLRAILDKLEPPPARPGPCPPPKPPGTPTRSWRSIAVDAVSRRSRPKREPGSPEALRAVPLLLVVIAPPNLTSDLARRKLRRVDVGVRGIRI